MKDKIFSIVRNCFKPSESVNSLNPWSLGILKSYSDYYEKEVK